MLRYALFFGVLIALANSLQAAPPTEIELTLRGQTLRGRPLLWTAENACVLARDGQLWEFPTSDAKEVHASREEFRGLTKNEMRAELQREFGEGFAVASTGNYLVVYPAGDAHDWPQRFESLYRSFQHYFQARGQRLQTPIFPLVAVVLKDQNDFLRYAASQGERVSPQVLGYYSPRTNRILMYDRQDAADWKENAETLIHEATHQTAFNVGVHNRWSMPPRWVAEGLGMMFEARGVYDASHFTSQGDRLNRARLAAFQQYAASKRPSGHLAQFLSSDRQFQTDPGNAYAEAWALTFYLCETEPNKYFSYLKATASHAPLTDVKGPTRLKDFTSIFGEKLDLLEAKMLRFIGELK